jgi:hypothetical protein
MQCDWLGMKNTRCMLHGYIVLGVLARIMFNVKRLVASMTALSAGRMNHESSRLIDMYRLQFA